MKRILFAIALLCSLTAARAQSSCGIENTAFRSGEFLTYDLHFNWKFVWVKVGTATMSTVMTTYEGQPAYRTSLTTGGNSKLDGVFTMRDTLLSYCNLSDLSPLYYRKGAREGKRYYIDELWYSYPEGKNHVKMHRRHNSGKHTYDEQDFEQCIYDMMSIFLRARNFDASTMKKGDIIPMPIMDAKKLTNSWLHFRGTDTFKVEGSKEKFRCLVFSFIEQDPKKKKKHELIRFYVTDDKNHLPVRLDMNLSFGTAKAYLRSYQGVRNEMTSIIK